MQRDFRGDPHGDHGEWGLLHWTPAYHTVRNPLRVFFGSNQSDNSCLGLATLPVQYFIEHTIDEKNNYKIVFLLILGGLSELWAWSCRPRPPYG